MSRIKNAFDHKKAFIGFLTAGDPTLDKTEEFVMDRARYSDYRSDRRRICDPGSEYQSIRSRLYNR